MGQHWRSETVAELGGSVLLEILGFKQEADLGGCWQYIQSYAQKEKIGVVEACMRVLDRTCAAVGLILDTAEAIRRERVGPIPEAIAATLDDLPLTLSPAERNLAMEP